MTIRTLIGLLLLVLTCLPSAALKDETIDELKNRLNSAKPEDQIKISIRIAERQVAATDDLFSSGNTESARAALDEVATYAEKAGSVAVETGRRMKDTEIAVRKMSRRLGDIKRTLSFEDQPVIDGVVRRLEDVRTTLLKRMFSKEKKQ